jgi:hypothetical protein
MCQTLTVAERRASQYQAIARHGIFVVVMCARLLLFAAVLVCYCTTEASGDFVLTLKNGRRITVQNYSDDGRTVKFFGLGGEIGISKDQILSIRTAGTEEQSELNVGERAAPSLTPRTTPQKPTVPQPAAGKPSTPEEQRAREEQEYQESLRSVTQQLQELRDRYSETTRGTTSKDPTVLSNEEQIKARTDDLIARHNDAQVNPPDPGVLRLLTPSPFSTHSPATIELRPPDPVGPTFATPPPNYTDRQKQLSDLRNQAIQLEKERERLINEMKQKNFNTGSLFMENSN